MMTSAGGVLGWFRSLVLIVLLVSCAIDSLPAQSPGPINTERPGFTSSPLAMPTGYWQLEAGYQYTRNTGSDAFTEYSLPLALLRYGFYRNLEIQFNWAGYTSVKSSGASTNGFQDAGVAVKWQLTDPEAALAVGVFANLSLPTGNRQFTRDGYDPSMGVYWTYTGRLNWFGAAVVSESADQYEFDNAVGISFSLTPNTGAFIEYLGSFSEGQGPGHELLGGITWALAEDLQVDINGGVGLNSRVADYFLGAGIGYRF